MAELKIAILSKRGRNRSGLNFSNNWAGNIFKLLLFLLFLLCDIKYNN